MPAHPIVDAHVHLWDPAVLEHPWLAEAPELRRRSTLAELDAERAPVELERVVVVEADARPDQAAAELDWILGLARAEPRIAGVVAALRLERGDALRAELERLAAEPLVKGVRRLLQSEPDPAFCTQPGLVAGVRSLGSLGLVFELCCRPHQLEQVLELVRRCPETRFMLDHLGKPAIAAGELDPWRSRLADLAREPHVWCKLSGLSTEADHASWTEDDLAPYVEHALASFGAERCVFGGDWPVARLATSYPRWVATLDALLAGLGEEERQGIWRKNAAAFYGLA